MHENSMRIMKRLVDGYIPKDSKLKILDVGSLDVNGTYKELFSNHDYTGLDIEGGENVDIVSTNPYCWTDIKDEEYDVVISGQCLEHVPMPWVWIKELSRVLKKDGIIIVIAPFICLPHYFPVDCWRILPDGMKTLFQYAGIRMIDTNLIKDGCYTDCYGIGIKGIEADLSSSSSLPS